MRCVGWVVPWALVVLLIAAAIAWAIPRPRVHKVSVEIFRQTEAEIVFYATWDIRHGVPDYVSCALVVDGNVVQKQSRSGEMAVLVPYTFFEEPPMVSGTKVMFVAFALNDGRAQRWKKDSLVVP